jgi:hypothetical protein
MEELLKACLDENFDLQHALDINIMYYSSDEEKQVQGMMSYMKGVSTELCDFYDITCSSRQKNKHFSFQCENNDDPLIATILKGEYINYGMDQGNQYAAFMGAYEIYSFTIEKPETCSIASKVMDTISYLVNYCLENFPNNYYIGQFVKNLFVGKKNTNIMQEEKKENICQDEDVDEVKEEGNKEEMVPSKLGDVC